MLAIPEVDAAGAAFGDIKDMPKWEALPKEFRDNWHYNPFCKVASSLFYEGGNLMERGLTPKEGVDEHKVYRILRAWLGSWAPKHEHKIAAVGYALSEWFDRDDKKATKAA